jgi:ArsR family transcriptional regulator
MEATTTIPLTSIPQSLCCPIDVVAPEDDELAGTASAFKALSDPTRLRILKTISHMTQLCECNIVPAFGLSQPTISYHLKVLREAGLITSERRGQWVWHRVNEKAVLNAVRRLSELTG